MAVVDLQSTDLANESDIIDFLRVELTTNHRFVERRNTGTVGANDVEVWLERPAAETFHGDRPLTLGLRAFGTDNTRGTLQFTMSYLTYANANLPTPDEPWTDMLGVPPLSRFNNVATEVTWSCGMSHMVAGAPYSRGRLVTSPDSGSATPAEELYFYLVVESATDVYRQMGIGEACKLENPFEGGMFMTGSWHDAAADIFGPHRLFGSGAGVSVLSQNDIGDFPGAVWAGDWGPTLTPNDGNGWMYFSSGEVSGVNSPSHWPAVGADVRGAYRDLLRLSPSAFSLQSMRLEPIFMGGLTRQVDTNYSHALMCSLPDLFIAEIGNRDAYSVFEDNGERFFVVPYYTKQGSGAGSSEKYGVLIRNPALVVT